MQRMMEGEEMKGVKQLMLAVGLAISAGPVYADTFQTIEQRSEVVQPAVVIQSWMQPTAVRRTEVKDQTGDVSVREEPFIWERHEQVMFPITKEESSTVIRQSPQQTITRVTERRYNSSSSVHRRVAHNQSAHRSLAYRGTVQSTSSSQTVQHTERTSEVPVIIERRDPALDLM
jgi:hypothetical protein